VQDGVKFGDDGACDGHVMGGKLHAVEVVGGKFGDAAGIVGRKLGDVAKESVRFEGAVAESGKRFGDDEDGAVFGGGSFDHPVLFPSSTWS
jgi:hypothetical protein